MAQPLPAAQARPHWTPSQPPVWLALNLALALSYWLAGQVGLAAAVGPGGTTAIWPATGWALGALLLWGWGALPGLVLGSLLTDSLSNPGQLLMAAQLSLASVLQWCIVKAVLTDWWPRMQASGGRFALRYVVVVCLGCLVATTIGNAVLLSFGKLSGSDWAYAWLTWWVGDSAGMLLVTPLMLMALHPGVRAHCVLNQAYPVLAIGVGLSLSGSFLVGHVERDARLHAQASDLRSLAQAVENQMALGLSDLLRLSALHYRARLSEAEFTQSARAIRTEHAWLSSLAYLARVSPEQRSELEERLGQNLSSVQPDGSLHNAPSQSNYWVPLRLDPLGGQEARVGVDEGSDPLRRPAIEAALRTGRPALTPVLSNLHYAQDDPLSVLAYAPVFEGLDGALSAEPTGLVSASLQLRDLLQTALSQFDRWQQPLLLLSDDSQPAGLLFDGRALRDLPASAAHSALQTWLGQPNLTQTIAFGSHRWTLRTPAQSADLRPSAVQAISLLIGLAFTTLLTAFLIARARRDEALARWREELELQVQQRTQELAGTNQDLRHEVLEPTAHGRSIARVRCRTGPPASAVARPARPHPRPGVDEGPARPVHPGEPRPGTFLQSGTRQPAGPAQCRHPAARPGRARPRAGCQRPPGGRPHRDRERSPGRCGQTLRAHHHPRGSAQCRGRAHRRAGRGARHHQAAGAGTGVAALPLAGRQRRPGLPDRRFGPDRGLSERHRQTLAGRHRLGGRRPRGASCRNTGVRPPWRTGRARCCRNCASAAIGAAS